ncbi:MAG: hypothetical protein R6X33_07705, partial [Candidatus Brocadiia bacterium]
LQKYQYNDYLTSDTSPTRWDIKGTFEANTRMTRKIWNLLNNLDKKEFEQLISGSDYLAQAASGRTSAPAWTTPARPSR